MATIKLRDYLESLSSKGSSALNDKITILDSADGSKIKTVTKSDLVNLTFLAAELRDDFLEQYGEGTISGSIQVDHDGTTNFVANEHIDHTGVTITSGNGLTGGGDISTSRTIDIVSANNGIITNTDDIELDTTSTTFTSGVKSKLNVESVISSSAQIDGEFLNTNGDDVVSSSIQITITDTTGFATLSSSLQSTDTSIAARVTAIESFSSSLDSTYASDSELTAVSSALDSTDNAIAARVTAVESFSSSLDSTYASDSELTAVSSAFDSTINSLTTADVTEDSSNKYYTDVRVKSKLNTETVVSSSAQVNFGDVSGDTDGVDEGSTNLYYTDVRVKSKLTAEDVVSGSNSDVKTFLGISASDISDVDAFSQSGTYASLRAQSTTAADVDLGNVTNESKATMFTSPAFTTNPTAPTQTNTDDSTKLATTQFVQARITDIIGNAGSTLDTLGELSASLAEDSGSLSTLTTTVGTKLAKASNLSDLQDAGTARTNLGVDAAGTVNYVLPTNLAGDDIDIDTTPLTGATVISDLDINITTNTSGLVTDANGTVSTRDLTATDLSLGNVTNESKATMFTSPTFTGTVGGVTNFGGNISTTGSLSISGDGLNPATFTESGNGDFDIVSVDDLRLTAGGNDIVLKGNSGNEYGRLSNDSQNLIIKNITSDKDISFVGKDGATEITALTLDMSNGGSATFRDDIDFGGKLTQTGTGDSTFSGSVGIGTNNPDGKLHLFGTSTATTSTGAEQLLIVENSVSGTPGLYGIGFHAQGGFLQAGINAFNTSAGGASADLQFWTKNSSAVYAERARITSLGELKIGAAATVNANGLSIEKTGNHIFLRATSATAGEYWNFDVTSNNELGILQDNGDGISIKDTGVLQTPNGIVLNSNTVTGNKTSVTFNDYEEGTWTPTITDLGGNAATLSSALGTYTKIGRQVILNYKVVLSSKASMTGNYVHIGGLPFNHAAGSAVGTGTVDFFKDMANSFSSLAWDITSTVSVGWLTGVDGTGAAGSVYLTVAKLSDTTELKGSLIYTT